MRLFHFSDDPGIGVFEPRPVRTPASRPAGQDWLNGPLVWAIDEPHSMLYLFPRECPRVLLWPLAHSTAADRARWMGETSARAVAYVEAGWMARLRAESLHRYAFAPDSFEDLRDVGMWVSRTAVQPTCVETIGQFDARLAEAGVELRVVDDLTFLRPVWGSSLHASGIRLRNALGWGDPGWPHTPAQSSR
ncbi:MAG TPA: hypothetical protein VHW60_07840 [Caulobacteraceae bacterium]|jgi:hypothetical protein|nr:hypothetical protein [Caulobacteraceae bacterium]